MTVPTQNMTELARRAAQAAATEKSSIAPQTDLQQAAATTIQAAVKKHQLRKNPVGRVATPEEEAELAALEAAKRAEAAAQQELNNLGRVATPAEEAELRRQMDELRAEREQRPPAFLNSPAPQEVGGGLQEELEARRVRAINMANALAAKPASVTAAPAAKKQDSHLTR